jgi:hypothetical protein
MSISSKRWRGSSVLIAAGGVAAAVLALAAPAGASTGTAEISPEQAGYTATGAQFQTIAAAVFLRQPGQYAGQVASYGHSVQLWSSGLVVTFGVTASTSGSGSYATYATIYDRSNHSVIASNPNGQTCTDDGYCDPGPTTFDPGSTVSLSITYVPADGQISMSEYDDGSGLFFNSSYTVTGQSFTQARVGTDFGSTPWDNSYSHTPPARYTKAATYSSAVLVTYSGRISTLWSWWVHHKLLANTEQQSSTDWVAIPTDLTQRGSIFQTWFVPQSGQRASQPTLP